MPKPFSRTNNKVGKSPNILLHSDLKITKQKPRRKLTPHLEHTNTG